MTAASKLLVVKRSAMALSSRVIMPSHLEIVAIFLVGNYIPVND